MLFPATACLVQNRIGARKAWGFDLSAACSGFPVRAHGGRAIRGAGTHKKVLVIGSDVMTSIIDFKDRSRLRPLRRWRGRGADGTGGSEAEGIRRFHARRGRLGRLNTCLCLRAASLHPASHETVEKRMHYVHQEGQQVFKYAVRRMAELACDLLERNGLTARRLTLVVPHQANMRIIRAMQERLGVDVSKDAGEYRPIRKYDGRHDSAGDCVDAVEQRRLHKGDLVLLIAVGAGYTTGACPDALGVLIRPEIVRLIP